VSLPGLPRRDVVTLHRAACYQPSCATSQPLTAGSADWMAAWPPRPVARIPPRAEDMLRMSWMSPQGPSGVQHRLSRALAEAARPTGRTTSSRAPDSLSVVPTYRLRRQPSCPVPFPMLSARRHYGALALHPGQTRLSRFWSNSWAAPFWGKQHS
jgi:hypothetical protein